jgi:predicted component of type VI protein secretion system
VKTPNKEGLHAKLERGIQKIEKKIEAAVSDFEERMDGPKLAVGDRVRSVVEYRRGMEGVIIEADCDGYMVNIESEANGERCDVECHFNLGELERL